MQTGELERLKEYGITKQMLIDQAAEMGKGEIVNASGQITDMEGLNEALFALMQERFGGGMELQSKTFKGMISNAKDAMGTIAREMSRPIFDKFKAGLASVLPVGDALVQFVKGDMKGSADTLKEAFGAETGQKIYNAFQMVKSGVSTAKDAFLAMQPTLSNVWGIVQDLAPIVGTVLGGAFKTLTTYLPPAVNGLTGIVKALTGWEGFIPTIVGLASAFATYKTIMTAVRVQQALANGVTKTAIALAKAQRAAHLAMVLSGGGVKGALVAMKAAMRSLNITMLANPFVLIAALLVGLGAGLVVAYKKSETFRKFVDGLWASLKKLGAYIGTAFMEDIGEIKELWGRIAARWKSDWEDVKSGFTALKNKFNSDISDIKKGFKAFINFFTDTLPGWVKTVVGHFSSVDQKARSKVNNMKTKIVGYIRGMKDNTVSFIKTLVSKSVEHFTSLYNNGKRIINNLKKTFDSVVKIIKGIFTGNFKLIKEGVSEYMGLARDALKNILSKMGINADDKVKKIKNFFVNGWNTIKDKTTEIFRKVYTTISGKIGDVVTAARNMPGKVGSAIKSKASSAVNAMSTMASSLKKKLTDKIADIKKSAGDIPGKIGSAIKKKVTDATDAMKDLASSLVKKFKKALGINSPSKVFFDMAGWIVKGLVNGLSAGNLKDLGTKVFKDFAGGAFSTLSKIKDWVKGGFDADFITGFSVKPKGDLNNWIKTAMAMTGTPDSWLGPLTTMAMKESGGRTGPETINKWDSNWAKGTPSMGLFQTIQPTFDAFKLPGFNEIMNPIHNAIAAIRYIKSRYGSVFNTPGIKSMMKGGPYKGYEYGGFVKERQLAWLAENNKPEAIVPLVGNRMDPFAVAVAGKLRDIFGNRPTQEGGITVHTEFHQSEPLSPAEIKRKQLQLARQLANEWRYGG